MQRCVGSIINKLLNQVSTDSGGPDNILRVVVVKQLASDVLVILYEACIKINHENKDSV